MTPVKIEYAYGPSGLCPVQAEGTINGYPFYFRARGEHISVEINQHHQGALNYEKWPFGIEFYGNREVYGNGERFAAGWIDPLEAVKFIEKCAIEFQEFLSAS